MGDGVWCLTQKEDSRMVLSWAIFSRRRWLLVNHDHPYDKASSASRALHDHNYCYSDAFKCKRSRIKYDTGLPQNFDCGDKLAMYMCKKCSYTTNFLTSLRLHNVKFHARQKSEKGYEHTEICHICNLCRFQTYSSLLYLKHDCPKTYGTAIWYCCNQCDFKSWLLEALENHQDSQHFRSVTFPTTYKCGECDYKSMTEACLLKHFQMVHTHSRGKIKIVGAFSDVGTWECNLCCFKTTAINTIGRHVNQHSEPTISWYQCGRCKIKLRTGVRHVCDKKVKS